MTCHYIDKDNSKTIKATASNYKVDLNVATDCKTFNVVYCITCKKCRIQYIGETWKSVSERFKEHKSYVTSKNLSKATGEHFNGPGHSVSDMSISVVEKIFSKDGFYRKEREKFYIQKFNSKFKGLNRKI